MGLRFDETLSLGEDSVFFFRYLSRVREVHVVEGAGYNYRVSAAGLSRRPLPWESHRRGGEAIAKVALPVLGRLLRGEFFYRKRLESLLLFGQHVFRLPFLYSSNCDGHARRKELSRVFRGRWRLFKTAFPLFCGNARHALLGCLFLVLPLCVMDFLLSRFFGDGGFGSVSRQP
ncbi:MAG: hypothetical protein LBG65_05595 [Puniceicoccales bacterium]|nr:hypothetical protein [Puniceicoccales bacterium]